MEKIKKFLGLYPKKNTVGVYRAGIYDFFDCLYGKVRKGKQVKKDEAERYEELAERYFNEQRDHFEDLLTFLAYMNGQPPIGARAKIAGVKEFISYHGVEFTQRQLKQITTKMPKGKSARTAEKDVDIELLRKILIHLDLNGKALTYVLASSGARIGEILQVKLSDVDLATTPPEIVVRGEYTKSGDTRTIFISTEAKGVLKEWLKIRDSYLESARNRNKGLVEKGRAKEKVIIDDDRLFPFTDRNMREIWENSLTKAGLWKKDKTTGWSQIRVHALRKFFRSQLALSCPLDIVEALMGHEGYLTAAYRRYTRKQMGEYYLKAEHHVTIMGSGDIKEIQDKLQDTHAAVEGYRGIISKQTEEIAELREEMMRRDDEITFLKDAVEEIRKTRQPGLTTVEKAILEFLKSNEGMKIISEKLEEQLKEEEIT